MKRILFLLFISLSTNVFSQSIYLDSLKNTFSGAISFSSSEDVSAKSFGVSYIIKGTINLGVTYITSNQEFENTDFNGSGFGGYASIMIQNELKGNPYGLELGLFLDETISKDKTEIERIESNTFGLGLFFSKNLSEKESSSSFLFQFGATLVPISESLVYDQFSNSERFVGPISYQLHVSPTIVLWNDSPLPIAIEPSLSYNPKFKIAVFSIGITAVLNRKLSS